MFVSVCVCVFLCASKRAVCLHTPCCALFEFTFTNGHTYCCTVVCCLEFSEVYLSNCNFAMTGLLSVFSLLPVKALKKRKHGQEKDEDEEDRGGAEIKQTGVHRLSAKDDEDSSDKDTER